MYVMLAGDSIENYIQCRLDWIKTNATYSE